ncbi:MAG: DUF2868 domain-containing protein [Burkholderiaceae bacterium]
MIEGQAREVALAQVLDEANPPDWQPSDRAWAARAACADTGLSIEQISSPEGPPERWLAARARRMLERLSERGSRWPVLLQRRVWPRRAGPLLAVCGLAGGLLADALSGGQRFNLLSPPFLMLLAWNLFTYLLLAADVVRAARRSEPWLLRLLGRSLARGDSASAPLEPAQTPAEKSAETVIRQEFGRLWRQRSAPLARARALAWLHLAAALFAIGMVASLYWRGLALEYRAGWESTFLDAAQVSALLGHLLWPAAAISGIALPDEAALAALNFSIGAGENAARWIHLFAITLMLAIGLPRGLMAVWQMIRARSLAHEFPWPLDDAARRRLLAGTRTGTLHGRWLVLPYGYTPPATTPALLRAALDQDGATLRLLEGWRLGDEDDRTPPRLDDGERLLVLFNLAATPEAEHHGRLLDMLSATLPESPVVVIDETRFRERFPADAARLEQRRTAWRGMLEGRCTARFLEPADDPAIDADPMRDPAQDAQTFRPVGSA